MCPEVLHPAVQGGAFGLRLKQGCAQGALMPQVCHQVVTVLQVPAGQQQIGQSLRVSRLKNTAVVFAQPSMRLV